jgi:hypothetical protein
MRDEYLVLRNNEITGGWRELLYGELEKLQLIFWGKIKRM